MIKKDSAIMKVSRQATAYARLAAKAYRAGDTRQAQAYERKSDQLRKEVKRMQERKAQRNKANPVGQSLYGKIK